MYSSSRLAKRDGADCYWFFVIMNIIQKCTWQDQIQNHNDHVLDCFLINWNGWQLNFDLKLGTFPDKGDDMILIIICYKINWLSGWSTKQCQSETLTFSDYEWLKLNYFMNLFLKLIIPKVASIYYVLNQHHDINQEIRQKLEIHTSEFCFKQLKLCWAKTEVLQLKSRQFYFELSSIRAASFARHCSNLRQAVLWSTN